MVISFNNNFKEEHVIILAWERYDMIITQHDFTN